jgi:glycolate oxidase
MAAMKSFAHATAQLKRRLGARVVRTEAAARRAASFDSSKILFDAAAVIRPRKESDIGIVLELANRHRVPVTTRGRGTTLTGAAAPVQGGWVLDMLALNRIAIDGDAGMAHVQAGATVGDIQRAADAAGWFYPPDPSSKEYCTLGGNIACNAGGMHGGKYGVTRGFRRGPARLSPDRRVRGVGHGDEEILRGLQHSRPVDRRRGHARRGDRRGPETDSAPGGAVDAAHVVPRRGGRVARCAGAVSFARAAGDLRVSRPGERAVRRTGDADHDLPGQAGRPVILLELAGSKFEIRDQRAKLLAWAKANAEGHRAARNRGEAEELRAVRRKCSGAMFELGDAKLNEDVVLPMRSYVKFAEFLARLKRESGLSVPTFGHLADGNLHVNIMYHRADPQETRAAEQAVERLMRTVVALGGSISGEHGIGLARRRSSASSIRRRKSARCRR